jgi:integrase
MRIGELLSLKWENLDFDTKTARVKDSVVMIKDRTKGENDDSKPNYILFEQSDVKTDSSDRIIQLNNKAITALKEIYAINGKHKHVMACSKGNIFTPRNFDRMLRNILRHCNLEPCGAHVLRHTFASMLFRNGVDVKTVSELLGHKDVAITYNTYIHLLKEQKQKAVEILDAM